MVKSRSPRRVPLPFQPCELRQAICLPEQLFPVKCGKAGLQKGEGGCCKIRFGKIKLVTDVAPSSCFIGVANTRNTGSL